MLKGSKAKPTRRKEPRLVLVKNVEAKCKWLLKLYIAGTTGKSQSALSNLRAVCEKHLQGIYQIEVIDLLVTPQLARGDQIFAVPTLVRQLPTPIKKIIGDLSNQERVLVGLNIKSAEGKV